jgi:hypothetical protein
MLALGMLATAAVAAPVPKAKVKEFNLDGKWETVERVNKGNAIKDPWVWQISGEELTPANKQPDGTLRGTFSGATTTFVRPDSTKPDEFEYRYTSGQTNLVYRGRVLWDGEEWVFCFSDAGGERPSEVKAGKDVYYLRFKRMSDK